MWEDDITGLQSDWGPVNNTYWVHVNPPNSPPNPSISVDGYGNGATITRPYGGSVTVTVRYDASDPDGNLSGIRYNVWNSTTGYFDNGGGGFVPQSGGSGEVAQTVVLNSDGVWYFWTDAQDDQGAYASTGAWGSGFQITVNQAPDRPPVVQPISGPTSLTFGQSGTYNYSVTDPDGDLVSMETYFASPSLGFGVSNNYWPNGQTFSVSGGSATCSRAFTFTAAGTWQAEYRVSDSSGWYNWTAIGSSNSSNLLNITIAKATPVVSSWPNNRGIPNNTGYTVTAAADLTLQLSNPFSASVAKPTGSITYNYTSALHGSGTIVPGVTVFQPDTYTVKAIYSGDSNYNGLESDVTWIVDNPVTTIEADFINITSGQTPSIISNQSATIYFGQSATIKAYSQDQGGLLKSQAIDYQPPPGSSNWVLGSSAAGTAWSGNPNPPTNPIFNNTLTWTMPFSVLNQLGTWQIRASGTDNMRTSNLAPATITLAKATPVSNWGAKTFSTTHSVSAQNDLNAAFTNPYTSSVTQPSGAITYTFASGGPGAVTAGMTLYPGTYVVRAICAADTNYNLATADATWTVTNQPPTVSLTASAANVAPGQPVTVTATANDVDGNLSSQTIDYCAPGSSNWVNVGNWSGGPAGSHTLTWSVPTSTSGVWQIRSSAGDGIATTSSSMPVTVATGITGPTGLKIYRPAQ